MERAAPLTAGTALLLGLGTLGAAMDDGTAAGPGARKPSIPTPPRRIVSTNVPTDEILLALDPPTRIVAVSTFADDPAVSNVVNEARDVPRRVTGDAERILAVEPGVVFAFPFGQGTTESLLRRAGVPVVHVPRTRSLDGIRDNIRRIGRIVNRRERARALIAEMDRTLDEVRRRVGSADRRSALLWNRGGFTSGKHTLFHELLRAAGGRNAAVRAGLDGTARLPVERALALDPAVVFVVDYRADARAREVVSRPPLLDDPLWAQVRAVENGHVYYLPERHLLSSSHHAVEAAVDMARALHPDRFEGGPPPSAPGHTPEASP